MPIKDPVKRAAYKAEWARRKLLADPRGTRERSRLRQEQWRKTNPDAYKAIRMAFKERNRDRLNETQREFRIANPNYSREARMKYYYAHPQLEQARAKRWRAENPGKFAALKRRWLLANPGRASETTAAYREKFRHIVRAQIAKRRALRRKAVPAWMTREDWTSIRSLYKKAWALSEKHGEPYHVDHIHPLSKGGLHEPGNLQVLRGIDNLRKGAKIIASAPLGSRRSKSSRAG